MALNGYRPTNKTVETLCRAVIENSTYQHVRGYKDYATKCSFCGIKIYADPPEKHDASCVLLLAERTLNRLHANSLEPSHDD